MIEQNINISKYKPLRDINYIKLSKELINFRKGLINIQNIDHYDCLKWCLDRYLHPVDRNPFFNKDFARKLDFKDIKFPVKTRDIHKIKKNNVSALVFLVIKIKKNYQSMFQKILLRGMSIYY